MTREEFNTFLKDWQVWRQDPNRELPSKLFDRKRRKAYEVFNETFFTGESGRKGDTPFKLQPVQRVGTVASVTKVSSDYADSFKSTGASKWSTCELEAPRHKQLINPIKVSRNRRGQIVGLNWDPSALKTQLEHWKWLFHNPRIALKVVEQTHTRKERLRDSALFL